MNVRLVVGLGNPGKKYVGTRHNAGFSVVESMVERNGLDFKAHARVPALVTEWREGGVQWIILKPVAFMNLSGQSVAAALNFWKIDLSELLIVVDDVEIPLGTLRLRPQGSAGGHNGLKSIIDHLGSRDFARLRVGIGRPAPGSRVLLKDWVLQPFEKSELPSMDECSKRAVCAIEAWALEGPAVAMNQYNTPPLSPAEGTVGATKLRTI